MKEEYLSTYQKQAIFSAYECIEDIQAFKEWYNNYSHSGKKIFYRGVKEAKYKNYTSAQRYCLDNNIDDLPLTIVHKEIENIRTSNNGLLEKYCNAIGVPCTDFYIMSIAQHYSKGYSLYLDFTTNIDTALFFMCFKSYNESHNSIDNYCSIYFSDNIGIPFENVIKHISESTNFSDKNDDVNIFRESSRYALKKLLSLTPFEMLFGRNNIIIENRQYPFIFSHKQHSFNTNIIVSNLNITAQDGCLLFYDNELKPLESNLCCVDINKSLIPYIRRNYLWPNKKTKKQLFPSNEKIISESIEIDKYL